MKLEEIDDGRRLQILIDAVVDYAIYLVSLEGKVLSWNTGAQRLKGYDAKEIVGMPFSTFYTPEEQASGVPENALEEAARVGRCELEGWRIRKDGSRFWALAVLDAVRDEDGNLIGYAKVTRDLTERREAEQKVLESERRFRRLVEAVVDYAIFQLDPSGNVVTWNPGAQRIKGYTQDEIVGRHFSQFYTPEDQQKGLPQQALQKAIADGRYEAESWRVRKDGGRFFASVVIDPIISADGEVLGFAKVTRDMTERREAQAALKAAQEQLAASQKMEAIGQLSGGIAHDFNNLMMIVLGNLESAQRHGTAAQNPNLTRSISNAMRGAQRATALTSRLLAFSRRQPLDPKPLDVNRFLSGAAEFMQRSLGETVSVECVGSAGLWQIEVDANHLEAALLNLAINSRDAMPDGGKLTIEATNVYLDEEYCQLNPEVKPGQCVLVCVTDNGEGMAPDVLARAFEPFFTTKEPGQGTGLGLSQVYGFVKQSGGHIKIYSEVGEGTTARLYFPRYVSVATEEATEDQEMPPHAEQGETILLVEDDTELRNYLLETLRGLGYRVLAAANGEEALTILHRKNLRIDLLLTDVVMPVMNGRELALQAQQERPDLKIVYMTGYSRNAVVHQGRLKEGVELLQKPISHSTLAARLRGFLDS